MREFMVQNEWFEQKAEGEEEVFGGGSDQCQTELRIFMQERETKTEGGKNRARETESATSPFWIEDLASGWIFPRDLLKWNSWC